MTRRKRDINDEERSLFESAFRDTMPLDAAGLKSKKADVTKSRQRTGKTAISKSSQIRAPGGLDGNTAERLGRGALEPEARLDLHGLTESAAHRALIAFLRGAAARGLRLVIVVTGKGLKPPAEDEPFDLGLNRRERGVLKTMTPRWLAEPELARLVADIRGAHRRHGGAGALYVYLRKNTR